MTPSTAFRLRLKDLRSAAAMTQEDLAAAVGVSTEAISSIERGVNNPSFDTMEHIAEALGVTMADLFTYADDRKGASQKRRRALALAADAAARLTDAEIETLTALLATYVESASRLAPRRRRKKAAAQ